MNILPLQSLRTVKLGLKPAVAYILLLCVANADAASMLRFDFTAVMSNCLVSCSGNEFEEIYMQTVTGSMLVPLNPQGPAFGDVEYLLGSESRFNLISGSKTFDVEDQQLTAMGIFDNKPCFGCPLPFEDSFYILFRADEYRYQLSFHETPRDGEAVSPGGEIISGAEVPSPHEYALFPVIEFAILNDEMPCCSNPGIFGDNVTVQVTRVPASRQVPIPMPALFIFAGLVNVASRNPIIRPLIMA